MELLRQYLLSVTAGALAVGILKKLLPEKGTASAIGKMVMGLFLALVVIGPLAKLELQEFSDFAGSFEQEASQAVAAGQAQTNLALRDIIKSRTEAYILDKAQQLNLQLQVIVELSSDDLPVPVAVRLTGPAAPYARQQLQDFIQQQLNIAKEDQLWT